MVDISIVVPAYNEAQNLAILIPIIVKTFKDFSIDGEIIIVDDGSEDETEQVCKEISERYRSNGVNIQILRHEKNLGKTRALSTGFQNCNGKYVFLFEADLQYDPRDIMRFIPLLDIGYHIVCGWRRHRADPPHRIMLSKVQNIVQRLIFGTNLNDHNVGFIGYRRWVALTLFDPTFIEELGVGRAYHRIVLALGRCLGFTIDEVPVRHYARKYGKSTIKGIRASIETLKAFIKLYTLLTFKRKKLFHIYNKVRKSR